MANPHRMFPSYSASTSTRYDFGIEPEHARCGQAVQRTILPQPETQVGDVAHPQRRFVDVFLVVDVVDEQVVGAGNAEDARGLPARACGWRRRRGRGRLRKARAFFSGSKAKNLASGSEWGGSAAALDARPAEDEAGIGVVDQADDGLILDEVGVVLDQFVFDGIPYAEGSAQFAVFRVSCRCRSVRRGRGSWRADGGGLRRAGRIRGGCCRVRGRTPRVSWDPISRGTSRGTRIGRAGRGGRAWSRVRR